MDVSMTTLSSGVLHTSLVMTVWHHMTGIFIRIHHRHRRIHANLKLPLAAFQPRFSTTAALRMPYYISTPMACFRSSSYPTSAAIQLYGHHP